MSHHLTIALLDKYVPAHFTGVKVKRPKYSPDSRFGIIVISALQHLELQPVYMSMLTDATYLCTDLASSADAIKIKSRILDEVWLDHTFSCCKIIWPLFRLLKFSDSMLLTASKIIGRAKQVEAFFVNELIAKEDEFEPPAVPRFKVNAAPPPLTRLPVVHVGIALSFTRSTVIE